MRRLAAIAAWLLVLITCAVSAEISLGRLDNGGAYIAIIGPFEVGDGDRFVSLAMREDASVVVLNSQGGNLLSGITIGQTIRLKNMRTLVLSDFTCLSACALAWLGGAERYMSRDRQVGFHAAWTDSRGNVEVSSEGNALVGAYLNQLGLPSFAIATLTRPPPHSVFWLTFQNAAGLGIGARDTDLFDSSPSADGAPPVLHLPLACPEGMTCPVQNYFDRAKGPEVLDHACGGMTYDGHTGTDFRVPTRAVMEAGVPVTASAAGVVVGIRDGVANHDGSEAVIQAAFAEGKECGNGVVIDHGGGWETQYCQLSPGLSVEQGDRVEAGATLGRVGISGATSFSGVHFIVRHAKGDDEEEELDPFRPDTATACGTSPAASLWAPEAAAVLGYASPQLLNAGFAVGQVTMQAIENGTAAVQPGADAPALVFFARSIGLRRGDVQTIRLLGPDGTVIDEQTAGPLDRNKAQWTLFIGRKRRGAAWPAGKYRGEFVVERNGTAVLKVERSLAITR